MAWKVVLAVVLLIAIILSVCSRAPAQAISSLELRRLTLSAMGFYAVGSLAWVAHHSGLALVLCAAGIVVCARAAWLSRGTDSEEPPDRELPVDAPPPPGLPGLDWDDFERAFRTYADGSSPSNRAPAGIR